MTNVAKHIIEHYSRLENNWKLPKGIELIYPFDSEAVNDLLNKFYNKFYTDHKSRIFLFGINPGRLGAGMTGVPFTDPVYLEQACGIPNEVKKKHELSSIFIYRMIEEYGGAKLFYSQFYVTSLCPLGFTKEGRNYNYYDSKELLAKVEKKMIESIEFQISKFCERRVAFSLGQGKNFKVFKELNNKYSWFDELVPLPHPRWVMQYKRKDLEKYLDEYMLKLSSAISR